MTTIQKKSLTAGKYVGTKHVDTVIKTYKKERWVHNSKRLGKPDSLSAWYSVEELEGFIETIKQYGADGIKFYFGAYPVDNAPRPDYAGLQTLVLVGTKRKKIENGIIDKDIYITKNQSSEILAYNMGKLCPPVCTGDFNEIGLTIIDKGDDGLVVV